MAEHLFNDLPFFQDFFTVMGGKIWYFESKIVTVLSDCRFLSPNSVKLQTPIICCINLRRWESKYVINNWTYKRVCSVWTYLGSSAPTALRNRTELCAVYRGYLAWSADDQWEKGSDDLESRLSIWSSAPIEAEQSKEALDKRRENGAGRVVHPSGWQNPRYASRICWGADFTIKSSRNCKQLQYNPFVFPVQSRMHFSMSQYL